MCKDAVHVVITHWKFFIYSTSKRNRCESCSQCFQHQKQSSANCRHRSAMSAKSLCAPSNSLRSVLLHACTCEFQTFGKQGCRRRTIRRTEFHYESRQNSGQRIRRTSVTHNTGGCKIPPCERTHSLDYHGVRAHTAYKGAALCSIQDG